MIKHTRRRSSDLRSYQREPAHRISLADLLDEDAAFEEMNAVAVKRVNAWQIAQAMKVQGISKSELAERMHTIRANSIACSTVRILT
jgi:hypothetical protein